MALIGTVLLGFFLASSPSTALADTGQGRVSYAGKVNVSDLPETKNQEHHFTMPFLPKNQAAFTQAKSKPKSINLNSALGPHLEKALMPMLVNFKAVHTISQFGGLDQSQCGCSPPDVQIAVGPDNVVEMVNTSEEIWRKNETPVMTVSLYTFYSVAQSDFLSDPRVFFDSGDNRWISSILDASTNTVKIAVSSSSDPTKSWNLYNVSFGANCPDQPSIATNDGLIIVSANDFSNCLTSPTLVGAQYFVLNKTQMMEGGQNPVMRPFGPDMTEFSIMPVKSLGPNPTMYMVTVDDNTSTLRLYSISGTASDPMVHTIDFPMRSVNIPPGAAQKGTGTPIETNDDRVLDAAWYGGKIWLALTDSCTPVGDTQARSCIRFTEIDTNSSKIIQDFDVGTAGMYYFYPALTIDGRGDLDAVFGYSSGSSYPGLMVATQAPSDTKNSLGSLQLFAVGAAPDTSGRYGDYFSASRDPENATNVFFAGEIHSLTSSSPSPWSTLIGSTDYVSAPEFPPAVPTLMVGMSALMVLTWGVGRGTMFPHK